MLDHLDDIESDMSAIHGIDDIWSMPAAKFFRFAWRLPFYQGVMRERKLKEQQEHEESGSAPQQQAPPGYAPAGSRTQPGTRAIIANDSMLSQIFSFG